MRLGVRQPWLYLHNRVRCVLQEQVMPRAMRALARVLRVNDLPDEAPLQLMSDCPDRPCACNGALLQELPASLFTCSPPPPPTSA